MLYSAMTCISINKLFLFLILLANITGKAQDTIYHISGKIVDDKTNKPINFAILTDFKTNISFQSKEDGSFEKLTKDKTVILIVSKLGYESQTVKVNHTTIFPITVSLKTRSHDLSEIVITANEPVKRLIDNTFYVLDYQFTNDHILLLGEMNNQHIVKLIDLNGKEISRLSLNKNKYESIFKDCFGNLHLVGKFHTNQLYFVDSKINLLDDVRRPLFDSVLVPCILSNSENIYFETLLNKKQTKTFFVINKATKEKSGLGIFSDEFKIKMMKNDVAFMEAKYGNTGNNTMGDITADELRAIRRKEDDVEFAARIIFTDAYIPILINNDTITIFNHPNSLIHQYSLNNTELSLHVMEYNHYKNWKPLVISDEIQHKYYTTYLHDGIITLGEINLKNGKIEKRFKLTHTFPKNIKIKDGVVYYLYRLRDSDDKMAIYAHQIK